MLAVVAVLAFVGPTAVLGAVAPAPSGVVLAAPGGPTGTGEPSDVPPGELPEPATSPAEVREAADDVLSGREFQRAEPNLIDRALDWISEQIGRLLQRVTTGDGASLLGWAVMLAAIVAIVVLLVRFGRTVQRDPGNDAEVRVDRRRTAAQWEDEAEQHEAGGEWKLALRCRFRALIATLVERGHVDDVPGRTTGEYRAEVRAGLPDVADAFAGATYLFEDAWYGDEPTGEAENARFRAFAADVLAHAPKRAVAVVVADAEAVPA